MSILIFHQLLSGKEGLNEIEWTGGRAGVAELKAFATLTRQGARVAEASRSVGIAREYASRGLKRNLVELPASKLMLESGVHPEIVSERPGRATVAFTLDTKSFIYSTWATKPSS